MDIGSTWVTRVPHLFDYLHKGFLVTESRVWMAELIFSNNIPNESL